MRKILNKLSRFNNDHFQKITYCLKLFLGICPIVWVYIRHDDLNNQIFFPISIFLLVLLLILCLKFQKYIDIFSFAQNFIVTIFITQSGLDYGPNQNQILLFFLTIFTLNENYERLLLKIIHYTFVFFYFETHIFNFSSFFFTCEVAFAFIYSVYNSWFISKTFKKERLIFKENTEFLHLYEEIVNHYPSNLIIFEKNREKTSKSLELKFSNDAAKKEFNIINNETLSNFLEEVQFNTKDLLNFQKENNEITSPCLLESNKRLLESATFKEENFERSQSRTIKKFLSTYRKNSSSEKENKPRNYRIFIVKFHFKGKMTFLLNLENISLEEEIIHLKEMDKIKDDTLASITHDLRSPLSSMLKWIENAKDSNNIVDNHKNLDFASNNGNMLMSLINDILDYSMMRNGKFKLNYTKFHLENLLQESVNLMRIQADLKEIKLSFTNKCSSNIVITSDFTRLKQILFNLIGNALKFTRKNGEVMLSVSSIPNEKNQIKFLVADNGIGIKPEIIPKLAQPYQTYDYSGKYNKNGVGLGLHICKNIIGQLGPEKKIQIESIFEQGSTFSFIIFINCLLKPNKNKFVTSDQLISLKNIKLEEEIISNNKDFFIEMNSISKELEKIKSEELIETKSSKKIPYSNEIPFFQSSKDFFENLKKDSVIEDEKKNNYEGDFETSELVKRKHILNILVADDDAFNQMIMKTIFSKFKLENDQIILNLEQAFNGEEAVQIFQKKNSPHSPYDERIHIIFMDCLMPIKNGFVAAQEIKTLILKESYINCKVIGCTSLQEQEKCIFCGMDEILIKPVENSKIFEILRQILTEKI